MKKFFLLTALFLISHFSFLISNAFAASEFSSSYDFTYEVLESGLTKVTQEIDLTNLTTGYYASDYSITFGNDKITEINARDNLGPLKFEVTYPNGTTVIHVFFNEKVLGIAKTFKWQLNYNSTGITQQEGRIWKINLPKIFKDDNPKNYNVKLIIPAAFGKPTYIDPKPKTEYFWTKDEGAKNGINLAFGDWQTYHFVLTYDLKNPHFVPKIREIILPQTTTSQEIILEGNRSTRYFLWPKQNLKIKITGYAKIFAYPFLPQALIQDPTVEMETNFVSQIPEDLKNKFVVKKETSEISFWQKIWTAIFSKP